MSRRGRLRRRGAGPAVNAGTNGSAAKSSVAVTTPVRAGVSRGDVPVRSDAPLRADAAARADGPSHTEVRPPIEVAPRADAAPGRRDGGEAFDDVALLSALEVEVPIDLSTELRLAAAAARPRAESSVAAPAVAPNGGAEGSTVEQLKVDVRRRLMERLDLAALDEVSDVRELAAKIRETSAEFLRKETAVLAAAEREEIVDQVVDEITGLGPIAPYVRDPSVADILVTGAHEIYVERSGRLVRVDSSFRDDTHLLTVIDRIVRRVGGRVDESSPMIDTRLPDGSRLNAIVPPLALDGPILSIRRFRPQLGIEALTTSGMLTRRMATLLAGCVHARLNILISGSSGSGKTTLLNALGAFVPAAERVVTVEDTAELRLQQEHVIRLETRPPNGDGQGEVDARDLVRNALRMRPTRIIVGDLRGVEAVDVLQAMSSGHEGSMATIHAISPRDALSRLETLMTLGASALPTRALREQIASTIDVVVQVARLSDGRRRVVSVSEVAGFDGDAIATKEIFAFQRSGVLGGRVLGRFTATGVRPRFTERLQIAGVSLPPRIFDESGESDEAAPSQANGAGAHTVTSPHDVGGAEERHTREARQLEARIRALEATLEQEKLAAQNARASVEELRSQVIATRLELDVMQDEVRAARYEADEQRELQAMLQQRSRSLAVSVTGFVEVLDDLLEAGRDSADGAVRDRCARLGDSASRLLGLFGLTEINGIGDPVDETKHEIVHHVPSSGHRAGSIVAVVQRGFAYHGQPVRRAQVLVAQ
jgi:pilus assembly protein CpaF